MFKSIFERLFWTSAIILLLVVVSVSAALSVFISNLAADRQYDTALKVSKTINYLTGYLQVENNNIRSRNYYVESLANWSDFMEADIIVTDLEGTVIESTNENIVSVPQEYVHSVSNGQIVRKKAKFGEWYDGQKVFTVGIPMEYYGTQIGGMYFNTRMPALSKMVSGILFWFLLAASISIIIAFALIYKQSTQISSAIR